jgi:hypothetical protein
LELLTTMKSKLAQFVGNQGDHKIPRTPVLYAEITRPNATVVVLHTAAMTASRLFSTRLSARVQCRDIAPKALILRNGRANPARAGLKILL